MEIHEDSSQCPETKRTGNLPKAPQPIQFYTDPAGSWHLLSEYILKTTVNKTRRGIWNILPCSFSLTLTIATMDRGAMQEISCSWLIFPIFSLSLVSEDYSPSQGHIHIYDAHLTHAPKHCTWFWSRALEDSHFSGMALREEGLNWGESVLVCFAQLWTKNRGWLVYK